MSDAADDDFGDFNDADAIVGEKRDEKDETHSESAEVETPDEKVEGQTEPLNTEDEVQTHEEHLEGFDWNAVSSPEHQLRAEEWNETTLSSASAASTEPGSDVDENVSENHATETQLNASDSQTEPLDNVEEAKDTETAEEPSPEPSPVAQFNDFNNPEPEEGFDEDDDFGDFGEVEEETAEVVAAEAEPAREPEPAAQETVADPLSSFYNLLREVPQPDFTTPETITSSFGALLSHLFPAAEPEFTSDDIAPKPLLQPATDASGRFYLAPNPDLATAFPDFARLADIPTYDEETGLPLFRWRRSEVRKAWLKALQVPVNLDDVSGGRCLLICSISHAFFQDVPSRQTVESGEFPY